MSFLIRLISSARKILLSTVHGFEFSSIGYNAHLTYPAYGNPNILEYCRYVSNFSGDYCYSSKQLLNIVNRGVRDQYFHMTPDIKMKT